MPQIHTIDLEFTGVPGVIACFLAPCPEGGFVLLESGPASTVAALEAGISQAGHRLADLRAVLVTHVHLDHSGGAGVLARHTGAEVFVHPRGAEHLLDPSKKLLPSAERLYGDMMLPLWGRVEPVPKAQLRLAEHAQTVSIGGLELTAWHTPGHAVHHVAWQVGDAVASGDVAGVRFAPSTHVMPPMPPPDIHIDDWTASLGVLQSVSPRRLLLTHFGAFDDAPRHINELEDRLHRWTNIARDAATRKADVGQLSAELLELDEREMSANETPKEAAQRYRHLCPMDANAAGLLRFVAKNDR